MTGRRRRYRDLDRRDGCQSSNALGQIVLCSAKELAYGVLKFVNTPFCSDDSSSQEMKADGASVAVPFSFEV